MSETAPGHRASLGFVFTVLLIDMLGFGIVIPVLPGLIMHLANVPIARAAEYAGWLGAGYAATQFVFAPIIGNLSDRFGRRPVLLMAILAMAVDYLVQAVTPVFWWLIIGRLLAGMTGASFSAAYAYAADITPPEKRATTFGTLGMAFGFGFVVGPALGGLLGTIGPRVPFIAASALAFANFLFGALFLRESLAPENRRAFDWRRANAFGAFKALRGQSATVLWFAAALGFWQLAHTVYPSTWAYFAIDAYGFGPKQVGLALASVGVASALVQGLGLRLLLPRVGYRAAVTIGIAGFCIAALLYAVPNSAWLVWPAIAVGALQGLIQPSIQGLNSRAVDAASQGELQGAVQSVGSIAQIAGPPLYTESLARFSGPGAWANLPAMPLLVAAGFALIAFALFLIGARKLSATLP